jgi:hypothetical protein
MKVALNTINQIKSNPIMIIIYPDALISTAYYDYQAINVCVCLMLFSSTFSQNIA